MSFCCDAGGAGREVGWLPGWRDGRMACDAPHSDADEMQGDDLGVMEERCWEFLSDGEKREIVCFHVVVRLETTKKGAQNFCDNYSCISPVIRRCPDRR